MGYILDYFIGFMIAWLSIMQMFVHKHWEFTPFAIIGLIIAIRARIKMKK